MKLGVGLPGYLGGAVEPATVIEWARRADQAGFHGVAVHDRPNHDAWDPLATLAAAAAVTERVRLATTVVLLPAYDETLLARQAAEDAGRERFPVGALAYVALSTDPEELAEGERLLTHYYGSLRKPFHLMVHTGDAAGVGEALAAYRASGLDVLYVFPVIPALAQLDRWAEELLPQVADPAPR
jgi:Luciferase-like monooxygenase